MSGKDGAGTDAAASSPAGSGGLYRPVTIGSLSVPGNIFLGPVAGYSGRAFRSICIEQGACFTYTELVSAEALARNPAHYGLDDPGRPPAELPPPANILRRANNEKQYAVQLFGANPETLYRAVLLLAPLHPQAVDLNCGCPVPKVVKTGAGSALMKNPGLLGRMVESAVRASREALGGVPVTVKLRSGWDAASVNYRECARIACAAGAALAALHARTRSQGYGGRADWSHIAELAALLPVPVAGSGDLFSPEDAERMLRETGCAAVMFARGAMGNPFIFSAVRSLLTTGSWQPADPVRRLRTGFRHLELLAEDLGETSACLEMRKQFCAYTKALGSGGPGLPGAAALRNRLVHAETIEQYREIFAAAGILGFDASRTKDTSETAAGPTPDKFGFME
ncbi:MAG: tRNA dihydrouridine synthase DusB [Treponema sp.]|nr:tRNA dihydrouridine synthase DusB [Treponema sp.]